MQTEALVNDSFKGNDFVMVLDGRLVVVTSATVYLLQADTSAWTSASVQYSVELSLSGQLSATTTLADTDLSVIVTTMNWVGALNAPSTAGPTMLRVEFPSLTTMSDDSNNDSNDATEESNNESTDESSDDSTYTTTAEPMSSSWRVATAFRGW